MELMKMPRAQVRKMYFPQAVSSLVDPSFSCILPAHQLLWAEPEGDLLLGTLNRVTAMNHIPVGNKKEIRLAVSRERLRREAATGEVSLQPI